MIEPYHISTIMAKGRWVIASWGLELETNEVLTWGGDVRVEFGLMTYDGIAKRLKFFPEARYECRV